MVRIGNKLAIIALRSAAARLQGTSKRQQPYHVDRWYHHVSSQVAKQIGGRHILTRGCKTTRQCNDWCQETIYIERQEPLDFSRLQHRSHLIIIPDATFIGFPIE